MGLLAAGPLLAQKQRTGPPPNQTVTRAFSAQLGVAPLDISFGAVDSGASAESTITLSNPVGLPVTITRLHMLLGGAGTGEAITVDLGGNVYTGGTGNVTHFIQGGLTLGPGATLPAVVTFAPTAERYDAIVVRFEGNFGTVDVDVDGLGGHVGHPFLHVVIDIPTYAVDYDADGAETILLDGSSSHTHEPGQVIVGYEWDEGGPVFSTEPIVGHSLAVGPHSITLTITDDNVPAETLAGSRTIDILTADQVPEVLGLYYDAGGSTPGALLDAVPANADFAETLLTYSVPGGSTIGASLMSGNVMVQLTGSVTLASDATYDFVATGGVDRRLDLDGLPVNGPQFLTAGTYALEARYAVETAISDLPLDVTVAVDGGPAMPIDPAAIVHDETALVPVINDMPALGTDLGGNLITIDGIGFFPNPLVTVHWGTTDLTEADFQSITPNRIEFLSPPGSGTIAVTVETPQGISNTRSFQYDPTGPVPINFTQVREVSVFQPTTGVWGPDGRFYVASRTGEIRAITFDQNYSVLDNQLYTGVSGLTNNEILGITINPFDPPFPVRLYVAHGQLFVNGGTTFSGPSPYTGQVSILEAPNFDTPVPYVTQMPTSNHDHGANGLVFDNNGDLLISVGGNTNAGVKHPNSGDLPESPLSGAILKVLTSKPGFNGAITYEETGTGVPNDDQVFGEMVDVAPGVDVVVQATGIRNAYDLLLATNGRLYATDNGPNFGFGAASMGPVTEGPDPQDDDELLLIEYGNYYGHPNRSRGRYDPGENVYYGSLSGPPSVPETFTQMVSWLPASSNGIDEYRADAFQGQIRGQFVVQEWIGYLRRVKLTPNGRGVVSQTVIPPFTSALSVRTGPGGALLAIDYSGGKIKILEPDDFAAIGLVVYDIFPWRAPAFGGDPFTIGGVGFGNLSNTSVTIGGNPAVLTSVTSERIVGLVPQELAPTTQMLDVEVTVDGESQILTEAFRYLSLPGAEPGRWEDLTPAPWPLGEVAGGIIDGILYVVGSNSPWMFAHDILGEAWLPNHPVRPYIGHHHAAEVVDGKLYLIGGIGGGSPGRVQIYDPIADSWSEGASMGWGGGSISTCVIDGLIYAAGGIVSTFTVANCAVYDPVADAWTPLAQMPEGRNHAAAGTDGEKFYIFGGRTAGNFVTNGFDDVFVYDPGTDTWDWTGQGGSSLVELPQARGGMGKAVYYRGEFYVFGGETLDGPGANAQNVYARVDVYDPVTNTWRLEAPMPNPRHGIFPLLFESRILLSHGGQQAGTAESLILDCFTRQ